MSNREKHGNLARLGLFQALAAAFGYTHSRERYNDHLGNRRNGSYSKGNTRDTRHHSPAGFKLIKKMYRRGYTGALVHPSIRRLALKTGRACNRGIARRAELKRQHQIADHNKPYWARHSRPVSR